METSRPVVVKRVPDRLNLRLSRIFLREVQPFLTSDRPQIVFDLSQVRHLDAAGVDMLLRRPTAIQPAEAGVLAPSALAQRLARFRGSSHSRILSGSLIMLVSSAVVAVVNFAYNVGVAQRLGPANFGHVATSVSLLLL